MPEAPVFVATRRAVHVLGSATLAVAALNWGQKILIPFALAILLTFVLSPSSPGWSGAA
jgi:predicted PurR-regulated permease PerM